jgi:hypothetical protein
MPGLAPFGAVSHTFSFAIMDLVSYNAGVFAPISVILLVKSLALHWAVPAAPMAVR